MRYFMTWKYGDRAGSRVPSLVDASFAPGDTPLEVYTFVELITISPRHTNWVRYFLEKYAVSRDCPRANYFRVLFSSKAISLPRDVKPREVNGYTRAPGFPGS